MRKLSWNVGSFTEAFYKSIRTLTVYILINYTRMRKLRKLLPKKVLIYILGGIYTIPLNEP